MAVLLTAAILTGVIFSLLNTDTGTPVTVGRPEYRTVIETIPANGKIQPVTEVKISPDVSGEIVELNVEEGGRVRKGDLLLKIRQDSYISLRDRALASLNAVRAQGRQQQARLAQSRSKYLRDSMLYEKKAITHEEFEASLTEYTMAKEELKAAEFNIESAKASLQEAEESLSRTVIYSPIDGTVSSLSVEKGERVVGTAQMAGTEMLRIADFSNMEVLVNVNENDIIRITCNDTADIEVDAYPGRHFKGVVTHIANSAGNHGNPAAVLADVTEFEVRIRILPESYHDLMRTDPVPFRPGMSASVEIETDRQDDALTVPLQAVTSDSHVFIYDKKTSTVTPVKVRTGIQDIGRIQITEGLTDTCGVWIVTSPYNTVSKILKDGMKVEVHFENSINDHEQ